MSPSLRDFAATVLGTNMSAATVGVGSVVSLGFRPPPDMRFATGDNTVESFVGRMETEAAPSDTNRDGALSSSSRRLDQFPRAPGDNSNTHTAAPRSGGLRISGTSAGNVAACAPPFPTVSATNWRPLMA